MTLPALWGVWRHTRRLLHSYRKWSQTSALQGRCSNGLALCTGATCDQVPRWDGHLPGGQGIAFWRFAPWWNFSIS